MPTPPDFSSGAVLTAAQMNAVGLWLVKTQTIGNAVSSVTVTGAFSADYDNYLVTVTGGVASTSASIGLRLGASATGYYAGLVYLVYSAAAVSVIGTNNGSSFNFVGAGTTSSLVVNMQIMNPFNAKTTGISNAYIDSSTVGAGGTHNGFHNSAVSYTAFTLLAGAGTWTGGTIRVYGMRN
jgi:hypothetical protein